MYKIEIVFDEDVTWDFIEHLSDEIDQICENFGWGDCYMLFAHEDEDEMD